MVTTMVSNATFHSLAGAYRPALANRMARIDTQNLPGVALSYACRPRWKPCTGLTIVNCAKYKDVAAPQKMRPHGFTED